MAELKTKVTEESVKDYIDAIEDDRQKKDCKQILKLMKGITKAKPKLWSHGAVGFGTYKYKGASGRTGEWYMTGFSPRKQSISIMLVSGFGHNKDLLKKLGKHKTGGGCLYIKKLEDIDMKVLEQLIKRNMKKMAELQKARGL